jgi:GT2 family glycosyltransferase
MRSSVIVVTYNHRQHVQQCMQTLLPTLGPDDEVVVVDNNSSDGTASFIAGAFPSVRLINNTDNRGFGAACNQAARESRSEFLVFLNPDTEVRAGWLNALLETLSATSRVGLATPKILLRNRPDTVDTFGHDVHISGLATCRGWGEPSHTRTTVEQVAAVSGACFAVRHDLFDRLGGFDERLFLYYEDDDLSLRARLAGFTCIAVSAAEVLHDHKPGFSPEKLRYLERNRLWTTLKLYRWSTLLALLPVILGAELLGTGLAIYLGPRHIVAKFRAWRDIVGWLPSLARERARVNHTLADRVVLRAHKPQLAFAQVATGRLADTAEALIGAAFTLFAPR